MALNEQAIADTQMAFDAVARDYGRTNDENPILVAMRRRTLAEVTSRIPSGSHLLDLGCGPGADADALARMGYRITALDSSPAMVEEARQRVRRSGLSDRVRVHHVGIQELDRLGGVVFDGACSNFGPLNCVPDLDAAARALAARLRPGASLVASVIGRVVPWELALFALKGDWGRLRVRFARGLVAVPLEGRRVWMRYHSPRGFGRIFERAGFRRVHLRSLGLLAPPPYMESFARRHPVLVERLMAVDDEVGAWPGLRQWGDHFVIVLRRT
jgi:SAM-dependent methyltransferase